MIKKIIFAIIIIVIAVTYKYYISNLDKTIYQSKPIVLGSISDSISARGKISLSDKINVGAQVSGQITHIYVNTGDYINKNDILLEIDPTLQKNELKKTQANLNVIEAQITFKNQQIEIKKLQIKRKNIIYKMEGVSQEEIEKLDLELKGLEAEYLVLQSQREQSLLERDNAEANLSYTIIKAPVSGNVLKIFAKEGQTIISSQESPTLLAIGNTSDLLVNVQVSEADVNKIYKGLALKYSLPSYPNQEYSGYVETIDLLPSYTESDKQNLNDSPVFYNASFRIKNNNKYFKPGLSVKVRFIINDKKNVITIPNHYVIFDNNSGKRFVYVLKNKTAVKKEIVIGANDDFNSEVIAGLNVGERFITSMKNSNIDGSK